MIVGLDTSTLETSEAAAVLELTRHTGVFSEEELATVQELIGANLAEGPEHSGYHFVLAHAGQDLAGFACYGPRPLTSGTFDLYWLVVAPGRARQGVGACLLGEVVARVRERGGRLLIAETSGKPEYEPARTFYLRHGFSLAATIPDFYAPGDDLAVYVLRLDSAPRPSE